MDLFRTASAWGFWKRLVSATCAAALVIMSAGCGTGTQRAGAVDPEAARAALKEALQEWKLGTAPSALRESTPSITVQDLDWERGCKLLEYEVLEAGRDDDANLRITVRLVVKEPDGREAEKQVKYVVGTDPLITVFREWL